MVHRAFRLSDLQEVPHLHRLVEDQRGAGNYVFKRFLGGERHGDATNADPGERWRRIDAEMPQHDAQSHQDVDEVGDATQHPQERMDGRAIAARDSSQDDAFDLGVENDQQRDHRDDGERGHRAGPELPHAERHGQLRQQPVAAQREQQQSGGDWKDGGDRPCGIRGEPPPERPDDRDEQPVQERGGHEKQRNADHHHEPLDPSQPGDPRLLEEVRQPPCGVLPGHFVIKRRHRLQGGARKQPEGFFPRPCHPLDHHLDFARRAHHSADDFDIGLERIGPRTSRFVADLRQPGGELRVEHDEQLLGEPLPCRLVDARIEVLASHLVLTPTGRAQEPEDRATRRLTAERIVRHRRRLPSRRRRGGGSAGSRRGLRRRGADPQRHDAQHHRRAQSTTAHTVLAANDVPKGASLAVPGSGVRTHEEPRPKNQEPGTRNLEPGTESESPPACRRSPDMPGDETGL